MKAMMAKHPDRFSFSVSHTTRSPRPGEAHGVDYYFTNRSHMEREIAEGKFLEHSEVHGNLYGTSLDAIRTATADGKICLADVSIDSAINISKTDWRSFIIFLRPVSMEGLEERLRARGTETDHSIAVRMQTAHEELTKAASLTSLWNLYIVNDNIDDTLAVISAELLKCYGFDPLS
jgi:guanylate kinase